jgi:fluoride ion exporter CrcB/FEX
MKIDGDILIKGSFFVAITVTIIVAFMDLTEFDKLFPLFIIGLIASLTFMIIAIYEVSNSTRIEKSEKIMWIVCIILLSNIAGILYIFSGRKRIIQ